MLKRLQEWMDQGHRARKMEMTAGERELVRDLHLLTMKPMLYVANVDESQVAEQFPPIDGVTPIPICAKVEADLADLDPSEAAEYLEEMGLAEPGLNVLCAGLRRFFTHSRPAFEQLAQRWLAGQPVASFDSSGMRSFAPMVTSSMSALATSSRNTPGLVIARQA